MSLSPARIIDTALEATIVGSFTRIGPAVRSRLDDWQPLSDFDLTGRTVLVTGGNGGLGTVHLTFQGEYPRFLSRMPDAA